MARKESYGFRLTQASQNIIYGGTEPFPGTTFLMTNQFGTFDKTIQQFTQKFTEPSSISSGRAGQLGVTTPAPASV